MTLIGCRSVFMGTPEIAVPALRLLAQRTRLQGVISQPDRPAGRGRQLRPSAVTLAARDLGLEAWRPTSLRQEAHAPFFADLDLIVVMAYGALLHPDLLRRPRVDSINLHASLLPRWRGASPLQAALRAGDHQTGVSVMRMVAELDAGPVYLRQAIPLDARADLTWLQQAMAQQAANALDAFLSAPELHPEPQDAAAATFCGKLTRADGHLDFTRSPDELCRWVRAYTPQPGCWSHAGGEVWRVLELAPRPAWLDARPGDLRCSDGELQVACGGGACAVLSLQTPGKRPVAGRDFLLGNQVPPRLE